MTDRKRESWLEQLTSAWRPRDAVSGGVTAHPAWFDAEEDERVEVAAATARLRRMEAALDPDGLSSTAHAVLSRLRG